jgi:hypothetical protein
MTSCLILPALALGLGLMAASTVLEAQGFRNPFGVADVADPASPRILELASRLSLPGNGEDRNAEQWAPDATPREDGGLAGEWYGRWATGTSGKAKIRVVGGRLFALYTESSGSMAGRSWLVEAIMLGNNRLMGSWVQVGVPSDTGPFIGRIVDDERIDGIWSWDGQQRWDFRRRLAP